MTTRRSNHSAYTSHSVLNLIDEVKILTIHRAKELEFPVVFLLGFVREWSPPEEELYVDEHLYNSGRI